MAASPLAALALLVLGLWNLSGPEMWWDEGWTLSVARNWVERGHYGRLFEGRLAAPGLEAAFPITGQVALSFRLFGVGIWQGRLPGVVVMVGALALIYWLAARLYNRRVAIGALVVLLLMPMHPQLHPLLMGRQVLAETPMLLFLFAGYACLLMALTRSRWWIAPAALWWGLAIVSKAQTLPFWAASLAVPLAVALSQRRWRDAGLLAVGMGGAYAVARYLWPPLQGLILAGRSSADVVSLGPVDGLYQVMAVVTNPFNRWYAVRAVLIAGLPALLGLCYGAWQAWRWIRRRESTPVEAAGATLRLALLSLAGIWLGWYLLLSVGVLRYLFPATYCAGIFTAALLHDLTDGFNARSTLGRIALALRRLRLDRRSAGAVLAIVMLALPIPITLMTLNRYYVHDSDPSAVEAADFINTQTPPGALIETYESELQFLLNRPYHYPPDQVHVEMNRRTLLMQEVTLQYDPLAANPAYLVVGNYARGTQLYDPVIASGAFHLVRRYGSYAIYQRVR